MLETLGLGGVTVRSDEGARAATDARGAGGLAVGSEVLLHPERGDPSTKEGREVLAHELVHQAQSRLPSSQDAGRDAAEQEAASLARAYAETGSIGTPQFAIDLSLAAADTDARRSGVTNPAYVNQYRVKILAAIAERIKASPLPRPHARLGWAGAEQAKQALAQAIWQFVDAAPHEALKQLGKLTYPADLFAIVDDARRGPDGTRLEIVKLRIAAAFDGPLHQSILRMGTRAVVKFDFKDGIRPDPREVIASSPLDGLVVQVLLQPTITNYHFAKKGAKDDTGGRPFRTGASGLTYEWLGKRDKNLWNWIHVTSPANPTAEDVAQLNLVGNGNEDSEQAYRIASNPPYFGIPIETAQLVPAAVEHAPDSIKKKLGTGPGPRAADPSALGKSVVSDDAALDDAPKPQKTDLPIDRAIDRTHAQLAFMEAKLGHWKLASELRGATAFVQRRSDEFVADRKRRTATPRR